MISRLENVIFFKFSFYNEYCIYVCVGVCVCMFVCVYVFIHLGSALKHFIAKFQ